ncbi:hypothetical protein J008_02880 [Cryptococcus neoformans]|nr:hypothetical protein AYX15_01245 [Cryptococcus neoformans var. grubii]OXG26778.1 hypothetical protein C367_02805 [Cryptococcus neoformans var. grubii Ze90-1]OXH33759.1 hypothetical protein J008_02880 [Cryptococcus neoformans var. grubii]
MILKRQKAYACFGIGLSLSTTPALPSPFHQKPLSYDSVESIDGCFPLSGLPSSSPSDNSPYVPRIDYAAVDEGDDGSTPSPDSMTLYPLHISGSREERVNLMFFSDGYTVGEEGKFVKDASKLKDDIVSHKGAMSHVAHLLNIWATFVPSNASGIGSHDKPLEDAAFGLYRPGAELRAVFVNNPRRARAACRWFRENKAKQGGCDQPILLGNDPLYGGLGGEFTVITASELNGPIVLRHELGHSIIDVGEEYDGGYAYFGVNSDTYKQGEALKWREFLTNPERLRIEDARVPLQVYPWHDLDISSWAISFNSSNLVSHQNGDLHYPTALLRASLSSIPHSSHISLVLNGHILDLADGFPKAWEGSSDRRWLEVPLILGTGLQPGRNTIKVALTDEGKKAKAGQGGKMIASLEIIEYGGDGRFNHTEGFIGAFPTYAMDGRVRLRPTNEGCLMRKVNHPTFCPVCAHYLEKRLEDIIRNR